MNNVVLQNKKANFSKLVKYGFTKNNKDYEYTTDIMDGDFTLKLRVSESGELCTELIDNASDEIYTLHLMEGAAGKFVGQVRTAYENVINDITDNCFDKEVFVNSCTKQVMEYIETKYTDSAEFLWEKFPRNAVYRRKDNQKWYAAVLTTKRCNLGLEGEQIEEILDLRAPAGEIGALIDNKDIFAGYHMNKKHWITIILDGSVSTEKIYKHIDISYELAFKK